MKGKYSLVGVDGNAFMIMGYVAKSMKSEGKSQLEVDEFYKEAKSGDYNHLLATSSNMIDKLNKGE